MATIVGVTVVVTTISVVIPNAVGPKSKGNQGGAVSTTQLPSSGGNQVGVLPTVTAAPLPTKEPVPTAAPSSAPVDTNARLVADMWVDAYASFVPGLSPTTEFV